MNPEQLRPPTPNTHSPISKEKVSSQTRDKTEAVKLFIESSEIFTYKWLILNREIFKIKAKRSREQRKLGCFLPENE